MKKKYSQIKSEWAIPIHNLVSNKCIVHKTKIRIIQHVYENISKSGEAQNTTLINQISKILRYYEHQLQIR